MQSSTRECKGAQGVEGLLFLSLRGTVEHAHAHYLAQRLWRELGGEDHADGTLGGVTSSKETAFAKQRMV